jgi:hypothetical protein
MWLLCLCAAMVLLLLLLLQGVVASTRPVLPEHSSM